MIRRKPCNLFSNLFQISSQSLDWNYWKQWLQSLLQSFCNLFSIFWVGWYRRYLQSFLQSVSNHLSRIIKEMFAIFYSICFQSLEQDYGGNVCNHFLQSVSLLATNCFVSTLTQWDYLQAAVWVVRYSSEYIKRQEHILHPVQELTSSCFLIFWANQLASGANVQKDATSYLMNFEFIRLFVVLWWPGRHCERCTSFAFDVRAACSFGFEWHRG